MDEFQYQMYFAKITNLKGTKKPLTEVIQELLNIAIEHSNTEGKARKYKLISYALSLSIAVRPITQRQQSQINRLLDSLIHSSILTPEQRVDTLEYTDTTINFRANSINDLLKINEYIKLLYPAKNATLSVYYIPIFSNFSYSHTAAYLYLKACDPTSVTLSLFNVSEYEIDRTKIELQNDITILNTALKGAN